MSRIGKKPVAVPEGVKVSVQGSTINIEGPKGKLAWTARSEVSVAFDAAAKTVTVTRQDDERLSKALHGTTRMIIANMIEGVRTGYLKKLEVYGVGYGVAVQGSKLMMTVGYSQPKPFDIPEGVKVEIQTPQARGESEPARFSVAGPDKQMVGEFAARVRKCRPPEPYKGKGIRYTGEYVRRKVGKAFGGAGTG